MIKHTIPSLLLIPFLLLVALAGAFPLYSQSLLYEFRFNDPANGTNTVSTGTASGTAAMTNFVAVGSTARESANLRSANGGGLSGLTGDFSLNNTISTQMGGSGATNGSGAGYGGLAEIEDVGFTFNGMSSYTIQGWYNATVMPTNFARLMRIGNTSILFQGTGSSTALRLGTQVGGATQTYDNNDSSVLQAGVWTFFAFTYNGITGEIQLYSGTDTNAVSLIGSTTVATGVTTNNSINDLTLANEFGSSQRPFDGSLDNFRVWSATSGTEGVLSLSQLQAIQTADLNNDPFPIPEPGASTALLLVGLMGLAWKRRRLHRPIA